MKRFLLKILSFCGFFCICLFIYLAIIIWYLKKGGYYSDAYGAKIEKLQTTPGRRIVIIGGSNTAFGIDSEKIHEATGWTVLNSGVSLYFGIQLALNDAKAYCHSGDILLIIPEYENFYTLAYGGEGALTILFALYPSIYERCELENFKVILSDSKKAFDAVSQSVLQSITTHSEGYRYNSAHINSYGDEADHWDDKNHYNLVPDKIDGEINADFIPKFIADIKALRDSGIDVYLLPPSIYRGFIDEYRLQIEDVATRLNAGGEGFEMLPDSMVFERDEMYDSYYHLNRKGTERRTQKIIDWLLENTDAGKSN